MHPLLLALADNPSLYALVLLLCTVGVVALVRSTVAALRDRGRSSRCSRCSPTTMRFAAPNLRMDAFGLLLSWLFKARSTVVFLPAAALFFQAPTLLIDPMLGVTALGDAVFAMAIFAFAQSLIVRAPFASRTRQRMRRLRQAVATRTTLTSP
jgi:hypothetical protein